MKFLTLLMLMLVFALNILPCSASAQDTNSTSGPDYQILEKSVEETIRLETDRLQKISNQLKQLQHTNQAAIAEINAYKVQISTHGNLLLLPSTDIRHLEKARSDNHIAIKNVEPRLNYFKEKLASLGTELEQTKGQIQLNKDQLDSFKKDDQETRDTVQDLKQLLNVLTAKQDSLIDAQSIYQQAIDQFESILSGLEALSVKFEEKITLRKKQFLFSRTHGPLVLFNK